MNDTRLLQIANAIEAAQEVAAEIQGEGVQDIHDRIALARIEALLRDTHKSIQRLYGLHLVTKGEK
jgi:hypothetical protein